MFDTCLTLVRVHQQKSKEVCTPESSSNFFFIRATVASRPLGLQPAFAILLILINRLAVVPTRQHMIRRPCKFHPDLSRACILPSLTSSINSFPRSPGPLQFVWDKRDIKSHLSFGPNVRWPSATEPVLYPCACPPAPTLISQNGFPIPAPKDTKTSWLVSDPSIHTTNVPRSAAGTFVLDVK